MACRAPERKPAVLGWRQASREKAAAWGKAMHAWPLLMLGSHRWAWQLVLAARPDFMACLGPCLRAELG